MLFTHSGLWNGSVGGIQPSTLEQIHVTTPLSVAQARSNMRDSETIMLAEQWHDWNEINGNVYNAWHAHFTWGFFGNRAFHTWISKDHAGAANYAFFDGHVQRLPPDDRSLAIGTGWNHDFGWYWGGHSR